MEFCEGWEGGIVLTEAGGLLLLPVGQCVDADADSWPAEGNSMGKSELGTEMLYILCHSLHMKAMLALSKTEIESLYASTLIQTQLLSSVHYITIPHSVPQALALPIPGRPKSPSISFSRHRITAKNAVSHPHFLLPPPFQYLNLSSDFILQELRQHHSSPDFQEPQTTRRTIPPTIEDLACNAAQP